MTDRLKPGDVGYDPYEEQARFVTNPFGTQEAVTLGALWWDYIDWMATQGFSLDALVRRCYEKKPSLPLSHSLHWLLADICVVREQEGLAQPDWMKSGVPPEGYQGF
jgi:hypothetical protein